MPTPNRTPASTRFEPPSPKANVRPATTIATSESPRAMVLVKAVIKTLTAFSQGELPPLREGRSRKEKADGSGRKEARTNGEEPESFAQEYFHKDVSVAFSKC